MADSFPRTWEIVVQNDIENAQKYKEWNKIPMREIIDAFVEGIKKDRSPIVFKKYNGVIPQWASKELAKSSVNDSIIYRAEFTFKVPVRYGFAFMNGEFGMRSWYRMLPAVKGTLIINQPLLLDLLPDAQILKKMRDILPAGQAAYSLDPDHGGKLWFSEELSGGSTVGVKLNPSDVMGEDIEYYKNDTGEKDNPNGFERLWEYGHQAFPNCQVPASTVVFEVKGGFVLTNDVVESGLDSLQKTLTKPIIAPHKENRIKQIMCLGFT